MGRRQATEQSGQFVLGFGRLQLRLTKHRRSRRLREPRRRRIAPGRVHASQPFGMIRAEVILGYGLH
jgi:hypothetical protein